MFRLFECCALSFFERFVLSFSLKIERFVSDSAEIWICGLYVYAIMEDKEKNIWLGTKGAGLFQLTPKGINRYSVTCFKHQPNNPYSISDNSIYSIFQDSHNRIWIGCYGGGLNLLIRRNNQTPIFIHSNNELKNYPTDYGMKVRNITEAPGGVLMVGTTNGLLTFSNKFELPEEVKFYRNCH